MQLKYGPLVFRRAPFLSTGILFEWKKPTFYWFAKPEGGSTIAQCPSDYMGEDVEHANGITLILMGYY